MTGIDTDLIELPQYAHLYFEQVIDEYNAVHSANPNAPVDELANEIMKKYRDGGSVTLTWSFIAALLSDSCLTRSTIWLREGPSSDRR